MRHEPSGSQESDQERSWQEAVLPGCDDGLAGSSIVLLDEDEDHVRGDCKCEARNKLSVEKSPFEARSSTVEGQQ